MDVDGALAGLAEKAVVLLSSLHAPALEPFMAEWPQSMLPCIPASDMPVAARCGEGALPVLRWLERIEQDEADFGGRLIADLRRLAALLPWRRTYADSEIDGEFLRNYGYIEVLGPQSHAATRVASGLLLLGPQTLYPRHRHEAEEVYVPLSGAAHWQQGDGDWCLRPPGTVIHHASEEPHATRTGTTPLLALYVWRSDDLRQRARLEREVRA
jgi:hypothetical protein